MAASVIGILGFLGATIGMAVVLALTSRSIAEYRAATEPETSNRESGDEASRG
jgi:hypothetical protein